MFKIIFLFLSFTVSLLSQQFADIYNSADSITASDTITKEKELMNYWGLHAGYVPYIENNLYTTHGMSIMLSTDNYSDRFLNWGWYFILKSCIPGIKNKIGSDRGEGGSITVGASLSHHFSKKPQSIIFKFGLGLRVPVYPSPASFISVEYQLPISKSLLFSLSLVEEIVIPLYFAPPLIGVGIVF